MGSGSGTVSIDEQPWQADDETHNGKRAEEGQLSAGRPVTHRIRSLSNPPLSWHAKPATTDDARVGRHEACFVHIHPTSPALHTVLTHHHYISSRSTPGSLPHRR